MKTKSSIQIALSAALVVLSAVLFFKPPKCVSMKPSKGQTEAQFLLSQNEKLVQSVNFHRKSFAFVTLLWGIYGLSLIGFPKRRKEEPVDGIAMEEIRKRVELD